MNLTEFLLARIAEDEAPTWELVPYRCKPGCCAPAGWVGHRCLICGTEEFGGTVDAITETATEHDERIHHRSRVLAECDAKRRIVGLHTDQHDDAGDPLSYDYPYVGCTTLRLLALPYANHGAYRQEWRPDPQAATDSLGA